MKASYKEKSGFEDFETGFFYWNIGIYFKSPSAIRYSAI